MIDTSGDYFDLYRLLNARHESSRVARARQLMTGKPQPKQDSGRLLRRPTVNRKADEIMKRNGF